MVRRVDIGSLAKPVFRPDGTVIADAVISRTGVFTYRNADGTTRNELRRDGEVFNPNSLASFRGVVLTNDHPPEMINSTNAKNYSVGAVLDAPRRDGDKMVTTIAVHDAGAIAAMKAGKVQVSNGYDCDLIEEAGVYEGVHYDAIQTNIVGNHVAIVHNARAGKEAAVRMDAAYSEHETTIPVAARKDEYMDLTQALAALAAANEKIGALTARADAAEHAAKTHKDAADAATARAEDAIEKSKLADKARTDAIAEAPAKVRARMALETKVASLLGKEFKMDSADDKSLKLAVIKHVTNVDCADKSEAYIDARYDAAIERASESADTFRATHEVIEASRADGEIDLAEQARKDMMRPRFIKPGAKV